MLKRLQVILSHSGVSSRRSAVEIIESGRVTVNGTVVRERGFSVDTRKDKVALDGRRLKLESKLYYLLNKPSGCVTTLSDEKGRRTVMDYMGNLSGRIYPIGRLDRDTEGVLLLTNDGELANRLSHPRYGVKKVYIAELENPLEQDDIDKLEKGVYLKGIKTSPCKVHVIKKSTGAMTIKLELHEGRKRQVKLMIAKVGSRVKKLKRISYAGIHAEGLALGHSRALTADEIKMLKSTVFLD